MLLPGFIIPSQNIDVYLDRSFVNLYIEKLYSGNFDGYKKDFIIYLPFQSPMGLPSLPGKNLGHRFPNPHTKILFCI